jgi:hypothetical protein
MPFSVHNGGMQDEKDTAVHTYGDFPRSIDHELLCVTPWQVRPPAP